jgi:hypothetical protein
LKEPKEDLINRERTWRTIICLNPEHDTLRFSTNETGNIPCPVCEELMVTEVIPKWNINELKNQE